MKKAKLDRIEDGLATFILEEDGTEWQVAKQNLSSDLQEGDAVTISKTGKIKKERNKTKADKARIADKLAKLREKNGR